MNPAIALLTSLLTVTAGLPAAAQRPPRAPRPPQTHQDRDRARHEATDRQVHKLPIGRNGALDLANISGDVTVTAGGGDEAVVEVILRGFGETPEEAKQQLELIYVDVIKGASRAEVRAKYRDRHGRRNYHASADYRVTAPAEVRVTVHSVSGDVQAARMKGELSIETVSGDVTIDSATRVIAARSVSGDVELTGIAAEGLLAASSVSGDVIARGLKAGRLELSTVSGGVELRDVSCDAAEIQSMSGDVQFVGTIAKRGRYELQSHSGNILIAPAVGSSGFEVELPLTLRSMDPDEERSSRRGRKRRSLRGTFGDGSAVLELTTFSGDIVISPSK
jgi:hypothetical protein